MLHLQRKPTYCSVSAYQEKNSQLAIKLLAFHSCQSNQRITT